MKLLSLLACTLALSVVNCANAQSNPVISQDFEANATSWKLFVPKESAEVTCSFTVENTAAHSGQKAARLTTSHNTRFGMRYVQPAPVPVVAGHHYRLTAWVKAGADFVAAPDSAGPVIRATLLDGQMKDAAGGHSYVDLQGVQRGEPTPLQGMSVPTNWTKIEGVVEIPPGASNLILFVFNWNSSGTLWVDDVSMIEVGS
jgi:hypothetical protein